MSVEYGNRVGSRGYKFPLLMLEVSAEAPRDTRDRTLLMRSQTEMQIFKESGNMQEGSKLVKRTGKEKVEQRKDMVLK